MDVSPVVAIVDDDAIVREALITLISANGYRSEVYESTDEFLTYAACSKAACLVVDIQFGGDRAIELSRRLAARGHSLPTIFLTAGDDRRLRRQVMDLGWFAFVRKPTETHWLLDFIAEAVCRQLDTPRVTASRMSLA